MVAENDLAVSSLNNWARLRNALCCGVFIAVTWWVSDFALSRGMTASVLLLLGMALVALGAVIVWRPVFGLYSAVFLNVAMDGAIAGDPVSKYTAYFHENLNTFAHAGIALSPLEILLLFTTLAYLLRTSAEMRLEGGALARPVLVFGVFLPFGLIWGLAHGGDWKIGLFEMRGPFLLVMVYFLVTNLVRDRRHLVQLLVAMTAGLAVLAFTELVALFAFLHGKAGGPDGAFGINHEDAVFLGYYALVCLLRVMSRATGKRFIVALLAPLSLVLMLEMQRRAASVSLVLALVILALTLLWRRPRVFFRITPVVAIVVALYCAAFWHSSSVWAEPIHAIRTSTASSDVDPRDLSSNLYRISEKANVRDTIRAWPLTGVGFGRQYLETHPVMHFPDFEFQFYTPHAEVLWIWLKLGAFGFIAFWVLICKALLQAGDFVRRVGTSPEGIACLAGVLYVVMILTYAYVDIGLANIRCEAVLGTALGLVGVVTHRGFGASQRGTRTTRRAFAAGGTP